MNTFDPRTAMTWDFLADLDNDRLTVNSLVCAASIAENGFPHSPIVWEY